MLAAWLRAFVVTQLVEMPIYRRALGVSWARAFAASAITHPLVWLFVIHAAGAIDAWTARVAIAEVLACVVEAAWFARVAGARRAAAVSVLANGASVALGLVLRRYVDV